VENGDEAVVADSFRVARESNGGVTRRQLAARLIADRKLAKALLAKFGPEQGARLVRDCSLGTKEMWLGGYRDAAWVVDGEVARAALDRPAFYDVLKRMTRTGGIWRIEWPAQNLGEWRRPQTEDEKSLDRWIADRPRRENDVLAHLDRY